MYRVLTILDKETLLKMALLLFYVIKTTTVIVLKSNNVSQFYIGDDHSLVNNGKYPPNVQLSPLFSKNIPTYYVLRTDTQNHPF